jgi:hypothetical protein
MSVDSSPTCYPPRFLVPILVDNLVLSLPSQPTGTCLPYTQVQVALLVLILSKLERVQVVNFEWYAIPRIGRHILCE